MDRDSQRKKDEITIDRGEPLREREKTVQVTAQALKFQLWPLRSVLEVRSSTV